jgi:hypothetical protein
LKKHLIFSLFLVVGVLASSAEAIDSVSKQGESLAPAKSASSDRPTPSLAALSAEQLPGRGQTGRKDDAEAIDWLLWRLLAPLVLGGVGATAINIYWSYRRRKREASGLILVITAEFVTAFSRCVTYYDQTTRGEIFYSSLFVLSDATVLSKFATLVGKADGVMAAMNLKSHFFQIERHAEAASRFIMDANSTGDIFQTGPLLDRARAEQGAAVGFFLSPYNEIVQDLGLLMNLSLKVAKGPVAQNL